MTMRIRRLMGIALAMLVIAAPTAAAVPVPVDIELALFVNIWKLDRTFDAAHITLAIVYQENYPDSVNVKDDLIEAVAKLKLPIICIPINAPTALDLHDRLSVTPANVVYIAPLRAVDVGTVAEVTRRRGLRSITGMPEYVDAGVAVGIGVRKNRPLIIVNLGGARAEGSSFSSQLLELARIVGPHS